MVDESNDWENKPGRHWSIGKPAKLAMRPVSERRAHWEDKVHFFRTAFDPKVARYYWVSMRHPKIPRRERWAMVDRLFNPTEMQPLVRAGTVHR